MHQILDDHLSAIVGRHVRRDHAVGRTLLGLIIGSVAMTCLVVGICGQCAAQLVSADTALRWSRGSIFQIDDGRQPEVAAQFAARIRPARTRNKNV